jgi:hypothetical protein
VTKYKSETKRKVSITKTYPTKEELKQATQKALKRYRIAIKSLGDK